MLTGSEIRRKFLDFFIQKGHREVHSSSLVPANDPTLLFTNAGMNQFKDVFLGLEKRDYSRAATSQKCVRAGGKHNDLENVGFTNRHHTFFEMLGNFSFGEFSGGYYKEEAINFAWELITSSEWFGIDSKKLYFTVFGGASLGPSGNTIQIGPDLLSRDAWQKAGAIPQHMKALSGEKGLKDNFWQMGDTGPCGACSEIFYDMGPAASDQGHAGCEFGCECGRYVEIWNLVFMQFNKYCCYEREGFPSDWDQRRKAGHKHSDDEGACQQLEPLPEKCVDTGMGLERLAAVLQGVISNYDTDLFTPLIKRAAELTGASLKKELDKEAHTKSAASLRVIADHARATAFLIADGVLPSNEGRGYVLRKIMRRAMRHAWLLGQKRPVVMTEMVIAVQKMMADVYPELTVSGQVVRAVSEEERRFHHTMEVGLEKLEELIGTAIVLRRRRALQHVIDGWRQDTTNKVYADEIFRVITASEPNLPAKDADAIQFLLVQLTALNQSNRNKLETQLRSAFNAPATILGADAFKLYDTYGLPSDFIEDAVRDAVLVLDKRGFDSAMAEQRERARASWKGAAKQTANPAYQQLPKSDFEGYRQTRSDNCEVLAIIRGGQGAQELKPGDSGEIILDHTPFYAESGGQVGDRGWLYSDDHNTVVAEVTGCYYPVQGVRAHQVVAKQAIRVGQKVDAVVDTAIREATMRNHTATHLLHAGLREVLGKHVKQAGSLVAPNHLRFDFAHFTGVEDEELQDIEDIINKEVLRNERVEIVENVPIDLAVNEYHAMALFGEKYGDKVRVIRIGDFSTELCGGTHTGATGEIGLIKILKEGSVSSGVRRIEAVTGEGSLRHFRKDHELESVVAALSSKEAGSPAEALRAELEKRDSEIKRLTRELDQARMKSASSAVASVSDKAKEVRGVKVLAHRVDNLERAQLRTLVDQLRDKLGSGVVVVGSAADGNVSLIAGVTKDLTSRIQAGKVVGAVAEKVGGKGGGRPDLAEAGGKDAAALDSALDSVYKVVESLLG